MKISVEYDGVVYSGETKDTSINVPWTEGLRIFFKILKKHGYVFKKIRPLVEACVAENITWVTSGGGKTDE
jgi:hypothetical protein